MERFSGDFAPSIGETWLTEGLSSKKKQINCEPLADLETEFFSGSEASSPLSESGKPNRYWSEDEHDRFLEAVRIHGYKNVKAIAEMVKTRTPTQVRSHAQKYLIKMTKQNQNGDGHSTPGPSPRPSQPSTPVFVRKRAADDPDLTPSPFLEPRSSKRYCDDFDDAASYTSHGSVHSSHGRGDRLWAHSPLQHQQQLQLPVGAPQLPPPLMAVPQLTPSLQVQQSHPSSHSLSQSHTPSSSQHTSCSTTPLWSHAPPYLWDNGAQGQTLSPGSDLQVPPLLATLGPEFGIEPEVGQDSELQHVGMVQHPGMKSGFTAQHPGLRSGMHGMQSSQQSGMGAHNRDRLQLDSSPYDPNPAPRLQLCGNFVDLNLVKGKWYTPIDSDDVI